MNKTHTDKDLNQLADQVETILDDLTPDQYHRVLSLTAWRRPWRPRRRGWNNVLDQLLHALYALIILFPIILLPSYGSAFLSGCLLGIIRETEQYFRQDLKILMIGDRIQDVLSFGLGGLAIYWLLTLVSRI
jgi:hypothetical protein